MANFLIRNDDVAFDTELAEIKQICEICDRYGFKIIQAITPLGLSGRSAHATRSNEEIKSLSLNKFEENRAVLEFLKARNDFIGVHGLWHTHSPTEDEIKTAKEILESLGLTPTYFVPPFNEGEYPKEIHGLTTSKLSFVNGERLEDFLNKDTPTAPIMYLHSWRFNHVKFKFKHLDQCLARLTSPPEPSKPPEPVIKKLTDNPVDAPRLWYNDWVRNNAKGSVLDVGKSKYWDYGFPTIDAKRHLHPTYVGSIEHTNFPDETFDTVLCNGMYEHTDYPQAMIDEVLRITKKGGTAIFGFVGRDYPPYRKIWKFYDGKEKLPVQTRKDFDNNYHFLICQKNSLNIQVYTAIIGGKDHPRSDIKVFTEADYEKFKSPVMNAKIFKILPHKFLEYDISLWIDGNLFLNVPKEQLVDEWLGDADMAVFEHYHKKNLYWEAHMLSKTFKHRTPWVIDEVNKHMEHNEKIGMPKREETVMGSMLIRRNKPIVNQFNEAWWAEICRWSQRDQLSLPIVIRQFPNLKVNLVKGSFKSHPYLKYVDHAHYDT